MKKLIAALFLLFIFGAVNGNSGDLEWIATADGGFASMPPTALTDGDVNRVSWSPDGEYLLVGERPNVVTQEQVKVSGISSEPGGLQLISWDRELQRVRTLWSSDNGTVSIEDIAWLHETTCALMTIRWVEASGPNNQEESRYGVIWLDTKAGKFQWVAGLEHLVARPRVSASPARPLAAVEFSDDPADDSDGATLLNWVSSGQNVVNGTVTFQVNLQSGSSAKDLTNSIISILQPEAKADNFWTLDGAGNVQQAVKLEKPLQLPIIWNLNGSAWFLRDEDSETKKQRLFHLTPDGKLVATDEQEFVPADRTSILSIESKKVLAELAKTKVSLANIWLKSSPAGDHTELLLSSNGSRPELSPTEGAVFYIDSGVAKVRSLLPLTVAQVKSLQRIAKLRDAAAADVREVDQLVRVYFETANGQGAAKPVPN